MALHTGLRYPQKLAGIIALSGYLPLADQFAAERHNANARTPIFMAHGNQDPVVVPARGEASRDLLTRLGYTVEWHSYPMPHSVHPQEVADIARFSLRYCPTRWIEPHGPRAHPGAPAVPDWPGVGH